MRCADRLGNIAMTRPGESARILAQTDRFCRQFIAYNVRDMPPLVPAPILGEFELLVLLALVRLGNGAFGAAIHREIVERTGRDTPLSAVYVTLDRLESKKMVCSYVGNPTRQRGGRRRKHFLLDTAGQRAIVQSCAAFVAMTAGLQTELEALAVRSGLSPAPLRPTAPRGRW